MSGRTLTGEGVFVCVTGFCTWFDVALQDEDARVYDAQELGVRIIQSVYGVKDAKTITSNREEYPKSVPMARKRFYGWRGNPADGGKTTRLFATWRMFFWTLWNRQRGKKKFEEQNEHYILCGEDQKPVTQFMIKVNCRPFEWLSVPVKHLTRRYHTWSDDIEVQCDVRDVKPLPDCNDVAPLRLLSWDIETYSHLRNFPQPEVPENCIMNIGASRQNLGSDEVQDYMFCMGSLPGDNRVPGAKETFVFQQEPSMLLRWQQWVMQDEGADVMISYNGRSFDMKYKVGRAKLHGMFEQFRSWSKLRKDSCEWEADQSGGSKQQGARTYSRWKRTFGVFDLDVYLFFLNSEKLESYKLDVVAELFLGDRKIDLSPEQMWNNFYTPEGRLQTSIYCVKDCRLPLRLTEKKQVLVQMIEMAKVTFTFLEDLQSRGQQLKIKNMLAFYCDRDGFIMNKPPEREPRSIPGATVIEPKKGYYLIPISTLDFTSLYPSIIQAHNLCWSSFLDKVSQLNWPNADYGKHEMVGTDRENVFVRHVPGVAPTVLTELLQARRDVKKMMNAEKDPFKKNVLNGRQLALKIVANSVYGFTSTPTNIYKCEEIGETTTQNGRNMIFQTKQLVEQRYTAEVLYEDEPDGVPAELKGRRAEVIYGDSVTGDTALIVRDKSTGIRTLRIDELIQQCHGSGGGCSSWEKYGNVKEACATAGLEVWQDGGFTAVARVIRHKCQKPIYRVLTGHGTVDCTSDHSLLLADGQKVSPKHVKLGTPLLHADDNELIAALNVMAQKGSQEVSQEDAFSMGVYVANGSLESRGFVLHDDMDPKLLLCSMNRLKYAEDMQIFLTELKARMVHLDDCHLVTRKETYRKMFFNAHGEKRIPSVILQASLEVLFLFYVGIVEGRRTCGPDDEAVDLFEETDAHKEFCTGIWIMARRLGWQPKYGKGSKNPACFDMWSEGSADQNSRMRRNKILSVELLDDGSAGSSKYVYDLETDSHHFHVGPGNLVVHNTDSVMIKLPVTADRAGLELSLRKGPSIAAYVTATFRRPINLEFEKTFMPFYLIKKKRYTGKKFEHSADQYVIDNKGSQVVRRDTFPFTKNLLKIIIERIIEHGDPEGCKKAVAEQLAMYVRGEVPFDQFILSKSLKTMEDYSNPERMAHVNVVRKMAQRNPGSEPQPGSRVPYVILYTNDRNAKTCVKAEDPKYAQEHKLQLDLTYYMEHCIRNPLESYYQIFDPEISVTLDSMKIRLENQMCGQLRFQNAGQGAPPPRKKTKTQDDKKGVRTFAAIISCDTPGSTRTQAPVSTTAIPTTKVSKPRRKADTSGQKRFC